MPSLLALSASTWLAVLGSPQIGTGPRTAAGSLPLAPRAYDVKLALWGDPVAGERWAILPASESSQGADLDGNGGIAGIVPFVYDLERGVARNLRVRTVPPYATEVEGARALLLRVEQGDADFTGDGEREDTVVFLLDLETGALTSSGVACFDGSNDETYALLSGDFAFLEAAERRAGRFDFGRDLNGDGDFDDHVVHAWDLRGTSAPVNTGISVPRFGVDWVAHESFLLFHAEGDGRDLHVYDAASGTHLDTGIPVRSWQALGRWSALLVPETHGASVDRNGDGDALDQVLCVFDAATGTMRNLGLAVGGPEKRFDVYPFELDDPHVFELGATALAFYVDEAEDGGVDRNGDGDASDHVLFAHDLASGLTANLGLAAWGYALSDELLAARVEEPWQGADLDGDGDAVGGVLHVVRLADGSLWNSGAETCGGETAGPASDFRLLGERVAFLGGACGVRVADAASLAVSDVGPADAFEWSRGKLALLEGELVSLHEPGSGALVPTGVAADEVLPSALAHLFVVLEHTAGADLNGDGDDSDRILRRLRARPPVR